jgi:hypothetical protein
MKYQGADTVRLGAEACVMEAFGTVRSVEFFVNTMNDEQHARFLHKSATAQSQVKGKS